MGNGLACMPGKDSEETRAGIGSRNKRGSLRKRGISEEDEVLHRQALAMARQQLSQRFEGSMSKRVDGSMSRRIGTGGNGAVSERNGSKIDSFDHSFCKICAQIFDSIHLWNKDSIVDRTRTLCD